LGRSGALTEPEKVADGIFSRRPRPVISTSPVSVNRRRLSFALGYHLEPGALQEERLDSPLGRWALIE
jgi:hypothetical protein